MPGPFRVLIAGLFHETHTFLEEETRWEHFRIRQGDELLSSRGDSSTLGGVLEVAAEYGWEVVPTIVANAAPSGSVSDEMFERYWQILKDDLLKAEQQQPLDAIYLILHGAMVCHRIPDVEGVLLERLRELLGDKRQIPIFGVYDLHVNFTPRMADFADCLSAYRCNPHTDGKESAIRAARLLQRSLESGIIPKTVLAQPPLIWPPTGTGTDTDPMKSLVQLARKIQADHSDFWEVNVNAGFAFADIHDCGVSFTIATSGDLKEAGDALDQLCQAAIDMAEIGNVVDPPVDEVLASLDRSASGLTVLVEAADNIGGGAPGDCTGLMRAMLKHELPNCAVCLCDPAAVAELKKHQPGAVLSLPLGGHRSSLDPGPLTLAVELVCLCDGYFELHDKQSHLATMSGDHYNMGDCAIVKHNEMTILLTSIKTPPMDLGQWLHVGIDPSQFSFVGVKAAVSHRRAWDPISKGNLWVSTPGPCSSDLKSFPYKNVRRPIFPLDPLPQE